MPFDAFRPFRPINIDVRSSAAPGLKEMNVGLTAGVLGAAILAVAACNASSTPTPAPAEATSIPTAPATCAPCLPQPLPTAAPTESEALKSTAKDFGSQETGVGLPYFEISGVPGQVDHNNLLKWSERPPEPGDVPHTNTIGVGTQAFLAEPGVRTVDRVEEEDQSAWSTSHADVQKVFEQPGPSFWGIPEGGSVMLIGAEMEFTFQGRNGPINVKLGAQENHGWVVIIRGLSRDYTTPQDRNNQLEIDEYNPGYLMATRLPPGQWVSEDYFRQNVDAAHKKNCGMDGCQSVSTAFVDPDGAFTVIQQDGLTGPWTQVATNIK